MTSQSEKSDQEVLDESDEEVSTLLRGALGASPPSTPNVLPAVQKRLRERSGGKFYADGWSTSKHPPIATYLLTSLFMLAILAIVYAALASLVGEAVEVENRPAPVQIFHPKQPR